MILEKKECYALSLGIQMTVIKTTLHIVYNIVKFVFQARIIFLFHSCMFFFTYVLVHKSVLKTNMLIVLANVLILFVFISDILRKKVLTKTLLNTPSQYH